MTDLHGNGARADRVRGVLAGLAAGDRIGGPIRMALRLAESLGELRRFDAADFGARLRLWHAEGSFDTGPVTGRVLERVAQGETFAHAASVVHRESGGLTAGCNPVHRSPPLAMAAFVPLDGLVPAAREQAALTHAHPLAGDVAAAMVLLTRDVVEGSAWGEALARVPADVLPAGAHAEPGGNGGFAPEAFRAAVHFVDRGASFGDALRAAINFAGPANYCPVLAGALAGARWGAASIPADALAHCDVLQRVRGAADALAAGW